MMGEEHGKDEISAQNMLKNHDALEQTVNDYAETIRTLGESARALINEGHAEGRGAINRTIGDKWKMAGKMAGRIEDGGNN